MIDLIEIAPSFCFVLAKGLLPGSSQYQESEFGNAALLLVGRPFSLRFLRDRGEVFVDVGSESEWHKLEYVLEFVGGFAVEKQLGEPPNPVTMASLLELHWHQVGDLFSDSEKLCRFRDFAQKKSTDFIRNLVRGR
jgi:hypothetical protein